MLDFTNNIIYNYVRAGLLPGVILSGDIWEAKMMNRYDVAIIGAGPAGVMAAYELIEKKPDLRIAVFETGKDIYGRSCPISQGKVSSCIGCKPCSIMRGFGGSGAFSDGK